MAFDPSKLTPIRIYYDTKTITEYWRVPLYRPDATYTVHVDTNFTRVFDGITLPNYIKSNMAMILACDNPNIIEDKDVTEFDILTMRSNILTMDTTGITWRNIGWRVSASWFCISVTGENIMQLRGTE